jgi:hypothetical protein
VRLRIHEPSLKIKNIAAIDANNTEWNFTIAEKVRLPGDQSPDCSQRRIHPADKPGNSRAPLEVRRFRAGRARFFSDLILFIFRFFALFTAMHFLRLSTLLPSDTILPPGGESRTMQVRCASGI